MGLTRMGHRAARGCWGKHRYDKKRDATVRAEELGIGWYRCEYCRGWHLTKQKGEGRR